MHCFDVEFAQPDDSISNLDDRNDARTEGDGFCHLDRDMVSAALARDACAEK